MNQIIFNPIDFGFKWTNDGWYTFDSKTAQKAALKARNAFAKEEKAKGKRVSCFSLPNQLVREGGIGSGKPDVEFVVNVYGVNVYG